MRLFGLLHDKSVMICYVEMVGLSFHAQWQCNRHDRAARKVAFSSVAKVLAIGLASALHDPQCRVSC